MHTLLALMLAVAASVVIARPPGPVGTPAPNEEPGLSPTRKYLKQLHNWQALLPRYLWPSHHQFEETHQGHNHLPRLSMLATEWLNKEIQRLSRIHEISSQLSRLVARRPSFHKRWPNPYDTRGHALPSYFDQQWPSWNLASEETTQDGELNELKQSVPVAPPPNEQDKKKMFALTPRDQGYFELTGQEHPSVNLTSENVRVSEGESAPLETPPPKLGAELPRHTRQKPNLGRPHQMNLVADDLDVLRIGFSPAHEDSVSRDNARHLGAQEGVSEYPGTFYGVALLSAIGAAIVLAVFGFAVGWYTLSKRAKAAAEVDYPAYGVTGPTIDTSGDRKLAHSAHMYHYQHQKQQIIAMERSGMEQRSGSVSDPESDEENEEGDYTVYECPGFATTGNMEVRNPLFNEEPTPATPGKCELVKPQPKE